MPQYKLLRGKMHPPRKGPGAGGKTALPGDIVTMSEGRAARYADMVERVMPAPALEPARDPAPVEAPKTKDEAPKVPGKSAKGGAKDPDIQLTQA